MGVLKKVRFRLVKVEKDIKGIRSDLKKYEEDEEQEALKRQALLRLHQLENKLDIRRT